MVNTSNRRCVAQLVASVSAGKSHSFAITVYGELYAWGKNSYGECGLGDKDVTFMPMKIGGDRYIDEQKDPLKVLYIPPE